MLTPDLSLPEMRGRYAGESGEPTLIFHRAEDQETVQVPESIAPKPTPLVFDDDDHSPGPRNAPSPVSKQLRVRRLWAGLALFALAALVISSIVINWFFRMEVTRDDAQIRQTWQQLTGQGLPAGYEPDSRQVFDNPVFSLSVVRASEEKGRGTILLIESATKMGSPEDVRKTLDPLYLQAEADLPRLKIASTETQKVAVRGEEVTFTIQRGEALTSNTKLNEVRGEFPSPNGRIRLIWQSENVAWDAHIVKTWLAGLK